MIWKQINFNVQAGQWNEGEVSGSIALTRLPYILPMLMDSMGILCIRLNMADMSALSAMSASSASSASSALFLPSLTYVESCDANGKVSSQQRKGHLGVRYLILYIVAPSYETLNFISLWEYPQLPSAITNSFGYDKAGPE